MECTESNRASTSSTTASLPDSSPRIRATTGCGTIAQKTWNLHRPITLIGSSRQAHICLPYPTVSNAHCLIVNTGSEVLVKDLHTPTGTLQNTDVVRFARLEDGDVLRIGPTPVQIAVRQPINVRQTVNKDDTTDRDPPTLCRRVCLVGSDGETWNVTQGIAVIGTDRRAEIQIDDSQASATHAVICSVDGHIALVDLGAKAGTELNDDPISTRQAVILTDGDCITVGSTRLTVKIAPADTTPSARTRSSDSTSQETTHPVAPVRHQLPRSDLADRLALLRTSIDSLSVRLNSTRRETHARDLFDPDPLNAARSTSARARADQQTVGA